MSSVLVLVIILVGCGTGPTRRRLLLRLPAPVLVRIVTSLLSVGSRGRRPQPMDDHATGDSPKNQRACDQNRSDHAKAAEDALHHVITNSNARP